MNKLNFVAERGSDANNSRASKATAYTREPSPLPPSIADRMVRMDEQEAKAKGIDTSPNARLSDADRNLLTEIAPGFDLDELEHTISDLDFKNLKVSDEKLMKANITLGGLGIAGTLITSMIAGLIHSRWMKSQGISAGMIDPHGFGPGALMGFAVATGIATIVGEPIFRKLKTSSEDGALAKTDRQINSNLMDALRSEGIVG